MKNRLVAGFTLAEMSIVLVIIGVIVGGVLLGRSVLTTSRLQAVVTDADSYITATGNFKQAYQALPGDMANATSYWGIAGGTAGDNYTITCSTIVNNSGTCNGNGGGTLGTTSYEYEIFRYWQQLYLAGMFSQKLSGVASSAGVYGATVGTNVPTSSIVGGGFAPLWKGTVAAADANFIAGAYGNVLIFGSGKNGVITTGGILTPDQAASIDGKIDDGIPGTGNVRSLIYNAAYSSACTTNASPSAYNVSNSGTVCPLIFITGY
jgi:prepilin-type N-terminal cleavage/methylation domain-containing protein